jgi:hypothetical protein
MSDERSTYRINPLLYLAPAGAIVLVMWGWFLLEHFTDVRLVPTGAQGHRAPVSLAFTLIVSLAVPIVAFIMYRRAAAILLNALPVTAVVKALGAPGRRMQDIVLSYTFEGRQYTRKLSISTLSAEGLSPGSEVRILVDRRNPKTVLVK